MTLYFVNAVLQTYVAVDNVNSAPTLTTKNVKTTPYTKNFQTVLQFPMSMATNNLQSADFGRAQAGEIRVPALITSLELSATQSLGNGTFTVTPTLSTKSDEADLAVSKRQDTETWDYWSVPVTGGVSPMLILVRDYPTMTNALPSFS